MRRSKKFLHKQSRKRERKALKQKQRFKAFSIIQNRNIRRRNPRYKRTRTENSPIYTFPSKERIELPEIFSISDDPEGVLQLVHKTKILINRRSRIVAYDFDFSNVKKVDDGAATILLSVCNDMNLRKFNVFVNLPKDEAARKFMTRSGFIKYFNFKNPDPTSPNVTIKKGKSKILPKESAKIIHEAMSTVYGADLRNTRLQGLMIELMTNSVNHAYLALKTKNRRHRTWLISSNHYKDENKVEFCFVDNGDGIIKTIFVKFGLKHIVPSEDILVKAFDGKYRSRTKLQNRGKGLIVVKDSHTKMTIRGLKVITNDVLLDFETNTATKLGTAFQGTFYSWILDQSCTRP